MPPSPVQLHQIHAAILDAFKREELKDLLFYRLGVQLDHIAGDKGLNDEATTVVQHYNRTGRLDDLIRAMLAERPGNPVVARLHADSRGWDFSRAPGTGAWEWLWINVPPRPNLVVGRDALLDDLAARLTSGQSAALSADGLPGVGKTTLAIALAHDERIQSYFADGVLWAGLGPNANVAAIQQTWADALGADLTGLGDPLARRARLNAAMADRRLLLVLDDAWQPEHAHALRGSGPHVAHVLTTRNGSLAREFAGAQQCVKVKVLEAEDAWNLLQELAPEACTADPDAARELADTVGGLPLAIELLAGYLGPDATLFPDLSKAAIAELTNPAARLALAKERLGGDGVAVTLDAVIALSVDDLRRSHPAAADAFLSLGAFAPKPATFDRAAAEFVAVADARTLAVLAARNLLDATPEGILSLHQVLHDFAAARTPPEAVLRHREHYLALANADREDWRTIEAAYDQVAHAWNSIPEQDGEALRAYCHAMRTYFDVRGLYRAETAWIERALVITLEPNERDALLNNIGHAYSNLGEQGRALEYYEEALQLVRQIGNQGGEATVLANIGAVYSDLGEKQQALEYYGQALPLQELTGDAVSQAQAFNNLGAVYSDFGEKPQALEYYEQALLLLRQMGNLSHEATTLNNIGSVYSALGDKVRALAYFEQALALRRQVGDRGGEATTLNNIGVVHDNLGEKLRALGCYEQALTLLRTIGNSTDEASALNNIGKIYSDLGDQRRALEYYEQALPLQRQVGDRGGEAATLCNIGMVYADLGEKVRALEYFEQALPVFRQVGDRRGEATTLNNIGGVHDALGEQARALGYFEQALVLARQVGDRSGEATTLNNIGMVYSGVGEMERALEYLERALSLLRQLGERWGEAAALNNIGQVYATLGEQQQALEFYEQSLDLLIAVHARHYECISRASIARAAAALGDLHRAVQELEQAVALGEALSHPDLPKHKAALEDMRARRAASM